MKAQNRFSWILRNVVLLSLMAAGTSEREFFIKTTDEESIAISVPFDTLIPTSASVRAGESFMPSPTIIT